MPGSRAGLVRRRGARLDPGSAIVVAGFRVSCAMVFLMVDSEERRRLALEHLRTLDLEPGARPSDLKAARLTLIKVWHPDRWENDANLRAKGEARLKAIEAAYTWLTGNDDVLADLVVDPWKTTEPPTSATAATAESVSSEPGSSRSRWIPVAAGVALLVAAGLTWAATRGPWSGPALDFDSTAVHPVVVQGDVYVVRAPKLNVRKRPSDDGSVVGILEAGDRVLAVSRFNGWRHIIEPHHGWVHGAYLVSE